MAKVVVITGGTAGVGRATAREFAAGGYNVAVLARDPERLRATEQELRRYGVQALGIPTDVSDPEAVEHAADRVEAELGPIDVWVNDAMATIFAPVAMIEPAEFRRATEVTYLGAVYGTMAALRRMRERNRGSIVNVGSALSYRAIPLQSAYCGSKFALRGFTESLRSEILHDRLNISLTMVQLPAINTPQFNWARNKMQRRPQPVPPIYQPEVPARAIYFAAHHARREIWLGWPSVKAIIGNMLIPGLIDRYLARAGYSGQLTDQRANPDAPNNLFKPVPGDEAAHGRFDNRAKELSTEFWVVRNRKWLGVAALVAAAAGIATATARTEGATTKCAARQVRRAAGRVRIAR